MYGDLSASGTTPFGFRYTGHHFDIGLEFANDGSGTVHDVMKYPQFIGACLYPANPKPEPEPRPNMFLTNRAAH